jgi:hypothetical protein
MSENKIKQINSRWLLLSATNSAVEALKDSPQLTLDRATKVNLITASGMFIGKIAGLNDDDVKNTTTIVLDAAAQNFISIREEYEKEGTIFIGNSASHIYLEDAVFVTTGGQRHSMSSVAIFVDDIIGYTFGSLQMN